MAALPYPAYGCSAAEYEWSGMHLLRDGGSALFGLRVWSG